MREFVERMVRLRFEELPLLDEAGNRRRLPDEAIEYLMSVVQWAIDKSPQNWEWFYAENADGKRFGPVYVMPLNDSMEHEDNPDCPCHPRIDHGGLRVIHNAFDGREFDEPDFDPFGEEDP